MKKVAWVFVFCILFSQISFTQSETFIRDIVDNPQRFYNLEVWVQGEIVDVAAPVRQAERGYFVLMDSSDRKIKIVSKILPAPQTYVSVRGTVQVFDDGEPYIREIQRVAGGPPCKDGDLRTEICRDGKTIVVARCVNGQWVPTGETCPNRRSLLIIALVVLIVAILIALFYIFLYNPESQALPQKADQPDLPSVSGPTAGLDHSETRQVSVSEVEQAVGGIKTKQVPSLLAEIRVTSGSLAGKGYPLGVETVIGRVQGDINLNDASVSRKHARIMFTDGKYVLENMSVTNPVMLNGEKLISKKDLKPGDEIICGLIKLQFRLL